MSTRMKVASIVAIQAGLVVLLTLAVNSRKIPLGLPGEWEWLRVRLSPPPISLLLAGVGVAFYAGFAAVGLLSLARPGSKQWREAGWVAALAVAAVGIQVVIPTGAADEYDLTKWAYVNYMGASTGYYQVARAQAMDDPWKFLRDYPTWIRSQDSLHIGTHPPGLIALQCALLGIMESSPGLTEALVRLMPHSTAQGFRHLVTLNRRSIPAADRAALYATSLLTLFACGGAVVPLYLLARASLSASASWAAAAFWPLVPAANLFQPDSDAAYPFFSTLAFALAAWAVRPSTSHGDSGLLSRAVLAVLSGLVLAVGVTFTLAFLPAGLIVGLVVAAAPSGGWRRKAALILAIGAGFLALTVAFWGFIGANPIPVWIWNLKNHARFYVEYPRTYRAWVVLNPVEFAIALGLPAVVWIAVGLLSPRHLPGGFWATLAVLTLLNMIGRNLGEVARLWLLFMPPLLLSAGAGLARLGGGPAALAASLGLMGFQTLALQAMIQVVYPV